MMSPDGGSRTERSAIMLEIAIDELGIDNDKVAYVTLPANKNAVIDAMDREKIFGETFLRITECDEVLQLRRAALRQDRAAECARLYRHDRKAAERHKTEK